MASRSTGRATAPLGALFACGAAGARGDAELIELFAAGRADPCAAGAAFEVLVARHGPEVIRACRRVLSDANDVDDAFQATFLVLARRALAGSIARPDALGPWLHGVAIRVARKARIAAARRRRHERRAVHPGDRDPIARQDLAGEVRDAVDRLPEPLRAPVVLCYLEELTYRAAARRLKVTEATIRGRLAKARGILRARLERSDAAASNSPARVPPALAFATIRAAVKMTTRMTTPAGTVAALMEGVSLMNVLTRWLIPAAAAVTLAISLAATGGGGTPTATAASPGDSSQPARAARPERRLTLDEAIARVLDNQKKTHADRMQIHPSVADRLTAALRVPASPRRDAPEAPPRMDINITRPLDVSLKSHARSRPHLKCTAETVTEAQYQDMARNAVDTLYKVYVDAQQARERVKWAEPDVEALERLNQLARKRPDRGRETTAERRRIQGALEVAELKLVEFRRVQARTSAALGLLLNLPAAEARDLVVDDLSRDMPAIPGSEELLRIARAARPDLAAMRLGLSRAEAELEDAKLHPVAHDPSIVYPEDPNVRRARLNVKQVRLRVESAEDFVRAEFALWDACRALDTPPMRTSWFDLKSALSHAADVEKRYDQDQANAEDVLKAREAVTSRESDYVARLAEVRRQILAINTEVGVRLFP